MDLGDLFEEIHVNDVMEGDISSYVVDVEASFEAALHIGDRIRQREGHLLRGQGRNRGLHPDIRRLLTAIEAAPVTVVAAVNGRCLAGGLELALACDLIAATHDARFFDAHLAGGLLPSGGASVRLRERIGRGSAFRLLVEGAELDAEEAVDWGLADVMFDGHDELLAWARTLAARLSRYPAGLLAQIKGQLAHGREPRDGQAFDRELTDLDSYP